jgi:hypothetical protein
LRCACGAAGSPWLTSTRRRCAPRGTSCAAAWSLLHTRSELLARIQNTNAQDTLPEFGKKIAYRTNRIGVAEAFADPHVRKTVEVDLQPFDFFDQPLTELELHPTKTAKEHEVHSFYLLRSILRVGKILAVVLRYEIHVIARFPRVQGCASYARLVRCPKE